MKTTGSKTGQISIKDVWNMVLLAVSFFGGFYLANTEVVNGLIGQWISTENVGVVTLFVAYFFKQLMQNNTK